MNLGKRKKILAKKRPERSLVKPLKSKGGRFFSGRISIRHRGGGVKKLYRLVDFKNQRLGERAKVQALEYDPNRTAYIALLEYEDGQKKYIIAPDKLKKGDEIIISEKAPLSPGNRMALKNIPVGTVVHNIEINPGQGGKIAKAAGNACEIVAQEGKYTILKMPSRELRKILSNCFASIGVVSNVEHRFQKVGKAGSRRLKGWRPTVRGSAMNPCDHPHGGGEGRTSIGLKYPKTPWGKPALGVRTRRRKWNDKLILKRRKKGKRNS